MHHLAVFPHAVTFIDEALVMGLWYNHSRGSDWRIAGLEKVCKLQPRCSKRDVSVSHEDKDSRNGRC